MSRSGVLLRLKEHEKYQLLVAQLVKRSVKLIAMESGKWGRYLACWSTGNM